MKYLPQKARSPDCSQDARELDRLRTFDNDILGTRMNQYEAGALVAVSASPTQNNAFVRSSSPDLPTLKEPNGFLSMPISPTKLFVAANSSGLLRPAFANCDRARSWSMSTASSSAARVGLFGRRTRLRPASSEITCPKTWSRRRSSLELANIRRFRRRRNRARPGDRRCAAASPSR